MAICPFEMLVHVYNLLEMVLKGYEYNVYKWLNKKNGQWSDHSIFMVFFQWLIADLTRCSGLGCMMHLVTGARFGAGSAPADGGAPGQMYLHSMRADSICIIWFAITYIYIYIHIYIYIYIYYTYNIYIYMCIYIYTSCSYNVSFSIEYRYIWFHYYCNQYDFHYYHWCCCYHQCCYSYWYVQ